MLLCVVSCWDPGFLGTSLKNGFSSQCPMFENASFPCIKCQAGYIHKSEHDKLLFVHLSHVSPELHEHIGIKQAPGDGDQNCWKFCQLQTSPAKKRKPVTAIRPWRIKKIGGGGRCSTPHPFKHGIAEAPVVQTAQFGPQGMHIRPKSPTQCGLARLERWGEEKFITWKPLQCSCAMGIGTHGAAIFTSSCGCEILPVLAFSTSDANGLWHKCSSRISYPPRFLSHFCLWSP